MISFVSSLMEKPYKQHTVTYGTEEKIGILPDKECRLLEILQINLIQHVMMIILKFEKISLNQHNELVKRIFIEIKKRSHIVRAYTAVLLQKMLFNGQVLLEGLIGINIPNETLAKNILKMSSSLFKNFSLVVAQLFLDVIETKKVKKHHLKHQLLILYACHETES